MLRNAWVVVLATLLLTAFAPGCSSAEDEYEDVDEGALSWIEEGSTGAPTDSPRCDQGLFWYGKCNRGERQIDLMGAREDGGKQMSKQRQRRAPRQGAG
jgi:hypothetical protein